MYSWIKIVRQWLYGKKSFRQPYRKGGFAEQEEISYIRRASWNDRWLPIVTASPSSVFKLIPSSGDTKPRRRRCIPPLDQSNHPHAINY